MTSQIERVPLKLPVGFDPEKPAHVARVVAAVERTHGSGFELESVDPAARTATAIRRPEIASVRAVGEAVEIGLPRTLRSPAAGERAAAQYEDLHPGLTMTIFDPHVGRAVLEKLSPAEKRARGAIAGAIGVKAWDIRIRSRRGGGFVADLPTYMPSRHQRRLDEVATGVIGRPGWYVTVDTRNNRAQFIPADLPTFPGTIPYPFDLGAKSPFRLPVGVALGGNGEPNTPLEMDLDGVAGGLVQGTAGSGKAQPLSTRIPVPLSDRFPSGWATIGELREGDRVFTMTESSARVAGLSDIVDRDVWEVHLSDGQVIEAAGDHLWRVSDVSQRAGDDRPGMVSRRDRFARQAETLERLAREQDPSVAAANVEIANLAGMSQQYTNRVLRQAGLDRTVGPLTRIARGHMQELRYSEYPVAVVAGALGREVPDAAPVMASSKSIAALLGIRQRTVNATIRELGLQPQRRIEQAWIPPKPHTASVPLYPLGEALLALAAERRSLAADYETKARRWRITSTEELAASLRSGAHTRWSIDLASGFDSPEADLPMDPYVLGAWLGDGTRRTGAITSADREIVNRVVSAGYTVRRMEQRGAAATYHFDGLFRDLRQILELDGQRRLIKTIPPQFLRASRHQRVALLAGVMDTDGTVSAKGACGIDLCDERLSLAVLELIRSLGIKTTMRPRPATITNELGEQRVTGTRYRISFTTSLPVFSLSRKASRLPAPDSVRLTQRRVYVTDVIKTGQRVQMRCLHIDDAAHMYLTDGFVPTHNSVHINSIVYGALDARHELVILDVPHKSVDFAWCRDLVRDHGWGCDSRAHAVAALRLVYEEGERRGRILAEHGVQKWQELPAIIRRSLPVITIVMDEVSGLLQADPVPKALPKSDPLRVEMEQAALEADMLAAYAAKIPAQLRFVGIRLLMASQQAQANTGIPPSLKLNLPHRVLLGPAATKQQRGHALANPDAAPEVPDYLAGDESASRGVGVAEFEGQRPVVFKAYYASTSEYRQRLEGGGVRRTERPEPTAEQIARLVPRVDDDMNDDRPSSRLDDGGWGAVDGRDVPQPRLRGAAAAAHQLRAESPG